MLKRIRYRIKVVSKLLPFAKGVKKFFILGLLVSVATLVLNLSLPLFYKIFIEDVILSGEFSKMAVVVVGYFSIFLGKVVLGYIENYAKNTLINTTLYRVKFRIWQGFFLRPFKDYETADIGDMKMRLDDDTEQVGSFASYQTIEYLMAYLTIFVCIALLVVIEWRLLLFSIIVIPLTFVFDNWISKKENVLKDSNRENDQKMSSWLHASVQGWREVKALNLERSQQKQFVRYLHNYALYFVKWINFWVARSVIIPKIKDEFLMKFGLYFFGGLLIMNGKLTIGNLLVFAMYYEMLSNAVKTVSSTDADLQSNMPFTDRFLQELDWVEENQSKIGKAPGLSNEIVFEKVSFGYSDTENEILRDFDLTIHNGERVAITGKSGSGKTTILKLMTGIVEPTSGSIFFSGIDLAEINLVEMHQRIGFVMQEDMLFNITIRENLKYGKPDALDEEILDACKMAYIHDFIMSLEGGLDTVIGEKGIKLSGGQRQRLILARLFLRDVDIFIFDEATSALDQYSENIVQEAIHSISKDKTIIVVAHRESSISLCDRKITLTT